MRPSVRSVRVIDGGLDMAVGLPVSWHCENDPYVSKILDHHHPGVPNHGDITRTDWGRVECVEWLTAGYPCQPFSQAGRRQGALDARHIWPDIAECIRCLRPRNIFLENVRGHLGLGFGEVLGDLAYLGYDTKWCCVRASDAGAPHQRERVFILATTDSNRLGWHGTWSEHKAGRLELANSSDAAGNADLNGQQGGLEYLQSLGGEGWQEATLGGSPPPYAGWLGQQRSDERDDPWSPSRQWKNSYGDGRQVVGYGPDHWGDYWPAISRWECITGRYAPLQVEPAVRRDWRLSAKFTEWMMGLPEGYVTDVPGLAWTRQIKALGNGVVPQQARLALGLLMEM